MAPYEVRDRVTQIENYLCKNMRVEFIQANVKKPRRTELTDPMGVQSVGRPAPSFSLPDR